VLIPTWCKLEQTLDRKDEEDENEWSVCLHDLDRDMNDNDSIFCSGCGHEGIVSGFEWQSGPSGTLSTMGEKPYE
jgi:hypothetical protein